MELGPGRGGLPEEDNGMSSDGEGWMPIGICGGDWAAIQNSSSIKISRSVGFILERGTRDEGEPIRTRRREREREGWRAREGIGNGCAGRCSKKISKAVGPIGGRTFLHRGLTKRS